MAHYMVLVDTDKALQPADAAPASGFGRFASRVFHFFHRDGSPPADEPPRPPEYIAGFVGMWMLTDECHVTSIAVRERYQGRGLGELLLIGIIDLAMRLKARMVTLEVRVSNVVAQNLYRKYGFSKVGVRKAYYTDNFEDGLLMSTQDIQSVEYQQQFERLKEAHFRKVGAPTYQVAS